MKKFLSVMMVVIMLVCCVPFSSYAVNTISEPTFSNYTFEKGDMLDPAVSEFVIPAGVTVTVPNGVELYIPSGTTLKVLKGATLNVYGKVVTFEDSTLKVEGNIAGAGRVTGEGSHIADVTFPDLSTAGLQNKIRVFYASAKTITENLSWTEIPATGGTVQAPLNRYFFVKAAMIDLDCDAAGYDILDKNYAEEKRYDDSQMYVYLNGTRIEYDMGSWRTVLSNASAVSYRGFTTEDDFLKLHKVYLESGEGYEIVGRNGESSSDGTVTLKHGQPFSFKVELDEAYDMSNVKVYIYNGYGWLNVSGEVQEGILDPGNITEGIPAVQPDENGYYNIPSVRKDCTVHVFGVIKNETITLIGNLLETFRSIFNMLKEFFDSIVGLFKGIGGTTQG